MFVTLLQGVSALLDIMMKMRELHKKGVDKRVVADIAKAVNDVHSKVTNYHYIFIKKGDIKHD